MCAHLVHMHEEARAGHEEARAGHELSLFAAPYLKTYLSPQQPFQVGH